MFDEPDLAIQWPVDLIVSELAACQTLGGDHIGRLMNEIFVGDNVLERYSAGEWGRDMDLFITSLDHEELVQRTLRAARSGQLREATTRPPRWRRRNSGELNEPPSGQTRTLASSFQILLAGFDSLGYFDRLTGRVCVDKDDPVRPLDTQVADEFGGYIDLKFLNRQFRVSSSQELYEHDRGGATRITNLGDDDLYELIEIFHDLAARPRGGHFHSFAGCGMHFSHFAVSTGQRLYRWRTNLLLKEHAVPLELADDGELKGRLVRVIDKERTQLVERVSSQAIEDARKEIDHAIDLFRSRSSTRQQKVSAIVVLAGILENERDLIGEELSNKDENALFHIANNFGLRHRNKAQQDDYHDDFLDWIFWWYLATIELLQRISARQR